MRKEQSEDEMRWEKSEAARCNFLSRGRGILLELISGNPQGKHLNEVDLQSSIKMTIYDLCPILSFKKGKN